MKKCEKCDLILVEQEVIPALGPNMDTVLDEDGVLTVTGELSDNPVAEGTTYIAVYAENGQMIYLEDITELDQSDFRVEIENVTDAYTVKVMRFAYSSYSPLTKAVEVDVK